MFFKLSWTLKTKITAVKLQVRQEIGTKGIFSQRVQTNI